jgi:hypothetical protein
MRHKLTSNTIWAIYALYLLGSALGLMTLTFVSDHQTKALCRDYAAQADFRLDRRMNKQKPTIPPSCNLQRRDGSYVSVPFDQIQLPGVEKIETLNRWGLGLLLSLVSPLFMLPPIALRRWALGRFKRQ